MVPELLVAALVVGWAMKGRIDRLVEAKIRFAWLVFLTLSLMVLTRVLNYNDIIPFSSPFHGIMRVVELTLLCMFAALNGRIPGAKLVLIGLVINTVAVAINGGAMPVSEDCIYAVWGKRGTADYLAQYPFVRGMFIDAQTRLPWLCDIIPARRPFVLINSVYSIGDLISTLGGMIAIISIMRTQLPTEKKSAKEEP